jgi:hypothetical protein
VYKSDSGEGLGAATAAVAPPGTTLSILDTLSEPEQVTAVAVYCSRQSSGDLGELVTRIELLSPANKPPGSYFRQYLAKREETVLSGVNLVEIDYLHQRRSPLALIPDYTRREANSYPYCYIGQQSASYTC